MDRQTAKIRIQFEPLQEFVSRLYQKVGAPTVAADAIARMQVETDLRGVYSHGTRAAPRYVRSIREG